jgi:hypothetical protein
MVAVDLEKLKLLDTVVTEELRLHPTAPGRSLPKGGAERGVRGLRASGCLKT